MKLVFFKSKKMPIGTISKGYKKVAEGKWVPIKQQKEKSKIESKSNLTLNKKYPSHIKITEGAKGYNVKTITSDGKFVVMRYRRIPKEIKFKNKMINDTNQDFSGGWFVKGKDLSEKALANRVVEGKKPFAALVVAKNESENFKKVFKKNNLEFFEKERKSSNWKGQVDLVFCKKGKLKDLFDLETLKKDYKNNGIDINIDKFKNKKLSDFLKDWDISKNTPGWITGLILGFPIENTISLHLTGNI